MGKAARPSGDRAARRGEVREGRGSTMVNMSSRQFLSGTSIAPAGRACTNGSRLFMKQKYSLNVQIIPGERENFEVSEKVRQGGPERRGAEGAQAPLSVRELAGHEEAQGRGEEAAQEVYEPRNKRRPHNLLRLLRSRPGQ